jgi:hypothetical protein
MADTPKIPGRRTDPRVHLTDPTFKYVPAAATDIRATFERIRAEASAKTGNPSVRMLRRSK